LIGRNRNLNIKEVLLPFELLVSQGRIADRSPGAILGAELTASAVQRATGIKPTIVGVPSASKTDDWSTSLPEAIETLKDIQANISAIISRSGRPLMVANTCSASLATLPIAAREHPDAIILWIDAHGDFNTPQTTASGYLGGMVLAAACGLWQSGLGAGVDPRNVVIVGGRDIDPLEADALRQENVRIIAPQEARPEKLLRIIGDRPVWIHVDWDVLAPGFVPAAYAVDDGLTPTDLQAIFDAIPKDQIVGIELAEFEASSEESDNDASLAHLLHAIFPLLARR
jgi:arginase